MATPKRDTAYDYYMILVKAGTVVASPTIVTGDFQVSIDGGAFADLAALPVVTPAGSVAVNVSLSAAEMGGDKIVVFASDQDGSEWDDVFTFIDAPVDNEDALTLMRQYMSNYSEIKQTGGGNRLVQIFPDGNTDGSGSPEHEFTIDVNGVIETRNPPS